MSEWNINNKKTPAYLLLDFIYLIWKSIYYTVVKRFWT